MTDQISEYLEYRGIQFTISEFPLLPYLNMHKDLKLEPPSSALWRGYHGSWLIKNNQLFLAKLFCNSNTLSQTFNNESPILASWYSGSIRIYVCDLENYDDEVHRGNYAWFKIAKGEVTERKIIKGINTFSSMSFGKYKGVSIHRLIYGTLHGSYSRYTLERYIEELIKFLSSKEYDRTIYAPFLSQTDENRSLLKSFQNRNGFTYLLTEEFIAFKKESYYQDGDTLVERFVEFLGKVLQVPSFEHLIYQARDKYDKEKFAESTLLIIPDYSYAEWAIQNVDSFEIAPDLISDGVSAEIIKGFDIKFLNSSIFEYKPIIKVETHFFSKETVEKNIKKFERKHSVTYDISNKVYLINISPDEIIKQYGFFLDETSSLPSRSERTSIEYSDNEDSYDYYNRMGDSDYFDAMTDGQLGDYNDFIERGGSIDDIE